ncbi:GTPase Era [Marivibrio halodurans]|uniref:GTPase Era n=1 Tax=Marivibrio halodurans TaxID=2039722 RepID=A0A8J7V2C1_9PROT|nr:GTPase Era [Marivibrio halodurans]MBP5856722.1 GTPase Era [Marivibrio halodurans]
MDKNLEDTQDSRTRAGFVAVIGAPNAGKSTLVNQLVGAKVSIVTHKVQTTRARVLGIALRGESQIALIDTPGIFTPKRRLDRAMVSAAWDGAGDADAVLLVVDATTGFEGEVETILNGLRKAGYGPRDPDDEGTGGRRALLALNKVDAVKRPALLALADRAQRTGMFSDIFMISALTGDGVGDLADHLAGLMPLGPWLYPEDQLSDMPQRLLAAEVVREKLYLNVHQEVPYALTVETESWEPRKDGSAKVEAVIYVERESQRSIILGKGGQRIKRIGQAAREELAEMLEHPVHLFLFVKVRDGWQDDPERYRTWNLDFNV